VEDEAEDKAGFSWPQDCSSKSKQRIDDDKSSLEQGRLPLRDRSGRLGSGGGWALAIMVVGGRQKGIIYDVALEEVDEKH
jgi:hypothetical protein